MKTVANFNPVFQLSQNSNPNCRHPTKHRVPLHPSPPHQISSSSIHHRSATSSLETESLTANLCSKPSLDIRDLSLSGASFGIGDPLIIQPETHLPSGQSNPSSFQLECSIIITRVKCS